MNHENNSQKLGEPASANGGLWSAPRNDILASVVVFLVALPLCMGIAIASGVPVAAGLITGIVGGLIVGWFSGAPLQVSGPAAGLTVIVYDLVQNHGLEVLGIAVIIGGALQLIAGVLRCGQWFRAVSPAVIRGMLAGIGVLILSSQFHVMVDDAPKGSGLQNLISIPEAIQKGLPIPEMGTTESRRERRNFLQRFGALHEQQQQLRELVGENVPASIQTTEAPENSASTKTSVGVELSESTLDDLAARQQALSKHLGLLVTQLKERNVFETVRDPGGLTRATQDSMAMMQVAVDDLEEARADHLRASQANIQQSLESVLGQLKNHHWAAKVGLLTIIVLLLWKVVVPSRLKLVPAPLVAVVVATVATAVLKLPVLYVEVPDRIWSEVHFPSMTVIQSTNWGVIIQAGIVLAVVASAETLLCATAVDQLQTHTRTNYDKELAAQGIGNILCGCLGALPMTGVIVRSSANVEAGGRTRLSTILHGLWLLVFVAVLGFVLRAIPTAALAAMLVYTGYKLVNVKAIRDLKKYGWGEVFIYFATLTTIVCTDLLTGVITGIVLSAIKLLYTFSHLRVELDVNKQEQSAVLSLKGAATFIRLPVLASELERVPHDVELHVDLQQLNYIDHACLDLLMNWAKQHEGTGGRLVIDWESLHTHLNGSPQTDAEELENKMTEESFGAA